MTERERIFRDIAKALLDDRLQGSCHGCRNVGDDSLLWLKRKFPEDLHFVRQKNSFIDIEAEIVEDNGR